MPEYREQQDGDFLITGSLTVLGGINDTDISEVQAVAQATNSTSEVLDVDVTGLLSDLSDLESDSKLTPSEKLVVQREWTNIENEYADIIGSAEAVELDAGDVAYSDYVTAYDNLDAYLNTSPGYLNDLTTTSDITGATLRSTFAAYFEKKAVLIEDINGEVQLAETLPPEAVAYWSFDDEAVGQSAENGDTILDNSGNSHDGTVTGTPDYVVGKSGSALDFDGSGDYLTVAHHADFEFAGDFSISGWVSFDNAAIASPSENLIAKTGGVTAKRWLFQRNYTDEIIYFNVRNSGDTGYDFVGTNAAVSNDGWHHVVAVRSSGTLYIYLDGVLQDDTASNAVVLDGTQDLSFSTGASLDGKLDEWCAFDTALTVEHVRWLYKHPGVISQVMVSSERIRKLSVTTEKIALLAVDTEQIANLAIEEEKLNTSSVTETKIADLAITAAKIALNAVTETKILDSAVTNAKLGADAVDGTKLADNAVDSEHVTASAITTTKINDLAITADKIALSAVETANINDGAVTGQKTAASTMTARELVFGGANVLTELGAEVIATDELFPLDFSGRSNMGRVPVEKAFQWVPEKLYDHNETSYDNAFAKGWESDSWYTPVMGFWPAGENLIQSPEDLTDTGNWNHTAVTVTLTDEYWDNKRWNKLSCDSTSEAVVAQDVSFTGSDNCIRILVRVGSSTSAGDDTRIAFYDSTNGFLGYVDIEWDQGSCTAADGAVIVDEVWHVAGEIVELSFKQGTGSVAGTTRIRIYPNLNETATDYVYVTAVQLEANAWPTPYMPAARPISALYYRYTWPDTGFMDLWIRPRFDFDVGSNKHIISDYDSDAPSGNAVNIDFFYNQATDQFQFSITGASGTTSVTAGHNGTAWGEGNAFAANTYLHDWIHFQLYWFDTDGVVDNARIYVNGTQIDSDATNTGEMTCNNNLSIGSIPLYATPANFTFEGEIADFRIGSTDGSSHASADVPYVDPNSVPNYTNTLILDRYGIKINRGDISMVDRFGRFIDIGSQGIMARDRGGTIVHDIPSGPVVVDGFYQGHVIWFKEDSSYLILADHTAGAPLSGNVTVDSWYTAVQCVKGGISNARGGIFQITTYYNSDPVGRSSAGVRVYVRPHESGWTFATNAAIPATGTTVTTGSTYLFDVTNTGSVMCPFGEDDQIDIYLTGGASHIRIMQLGVYV